MSCTKEHHECGRMYSSSWCCHSCSEHQQERCIEHDTICDCLWDEGCNLAKEIYMKAISSEESYSKHLEENKPHNLLTKQ